MSKTKTKQNRQKNASEPTPIRPSSFIAMLKKYFTPLVAGLIIGLLLGLSAFYLVTYTSTKKTYNQNLLVFAGGGSVAKFLDEKYLKDIERDTSGTYFRNNNYPNGIYLHVPSLDALTLLSEEAIMPCSRANQPFYPVCFSSTKATEESFTKKCPQELLTKKGGYIAEFLLGYENLAVYVENKADGLSGLSHIANKLITVDELIGRLLSGCYNIFSTSKTSGTYVAFNETLFKNSKGKYDLSKIPPEEFNEFSSQTPLDGVQKDNNKPFIIMGSDFYRPEDLNRLDHEGYFKLLLVNNSDTIKRPIYLYFMAYHSEDKDKNDIYEIPKEVLDLLAFLKFKNKKGLITGNKLKVSDTNKLIVPIE